jgi:hypothetical protein
MYFVMFWSNILNKFVRKGKKEFPPLPIEEMRNFLRGGNTVIQIFIDKSTKIHPNIEVIQSNSSKVPLVKIKI